MVVVQCKILCCDIVFNIAFSQTVLCKSSNSFCCFFFVSIIRFVLFVFLFLFVFFYVFLCFLEWKESSPKMSMLDWRGVERIDTHLTL